MSVTVPGVIKKKRDGKRISALTAYDAPMARMVDGAGVDIILVGDSLSNVILGRKDTLSVTMEEMLHHTRAVSSVVERALVVGDMPFLSYQVSAKEAITNAGRFIKEAGASAVKLEGGRDSLIRRIVEAEIPVMGHLGLTPQSLHRMGGYRVQGKTAKTRLELLRQAEGLQAAGAFAVVLEGVPREVAADITARLDIPTIGIGAGPDCDGQILVFHDLLGLLPEEPPKFVRRYASLFETGRTAIAAYVRDIELGRFPSDEESYHAPRGQEMAAAIDDDFEDWI